MRFPMWERFAPYRVSYFRIFGANAHPGREGGEMGSL
jgi:hypothetical protein